MYSIGNFIFGINLCDDKVPTKHQGVVSELYDMDLIESHYSGNGEAPMFMGVDVTSIDEASDMTWAEIGELKDKLKAAMAEGSPQQLNFTKKLDALKKEIDDGIDEADFEPEDYKNFMDWLEAQKPEVFLTWSTS